MPFFIPELHNVLFYLITALWILEIIIFKPHFRKVDLAEKQKHRTILIVVATIIAGTVIYNYMGLFILQESTFTYFNYIGVTLYFVGILIRYASRWALKRHESKDTLSGSSPLISHGPYRLLAHPLILGLFLLVLAVPIYFGQVIWIMGAVLFFSRTLNNFMANEEKNLEASLKETYTLWRKKRYRFIPWIY